MADPTKSAERSIGALLDDANGRLAEARAKRAAADRAAARAKERERAAEAERDRLAKALSLLRGEEPARERKTGVLDETALTDVLRFIRAAPRQRASVAQVWRGLGWGPGKSSRTKRYMDTLVSRGLLEPTGEVYQHGPSPIGRSPIYAATNVVEYTTRKAAAR